MTESRVTSREAEAMRRFITKLPHNADPALVILKAHLLIEEQLRLLVDERMAKPKALQTAELECNQVICIAEALTGDTLMPQMWTALRKLNKLRNDLAHQLDPKGLTDRIAYVAKVVGETHPMWEGDTPWPDLMTEFDAAMWVLFVRVSALVERPSARIVSIEGGPFAEQAP
jgi:hypothetical protein